MVLVCIKYVLEHMGSGTMGPCLEGLVAPALRTAVGVSTTPGRWPHVAARTSGTEDPRALSTTPATYPRVHRRPHKATQPCTETRRPLRDKPLPEPIITGTPRWVRLPRDPIPTERARPPPGPTRTETPRGVRPHRDPTPTETPRPAEPAPWAAAPAESSRLTARPTASAAVMRLTPRMTSWPWPLDRWPKSVAVHATKSSTVATASSRR